MWRFGGKDVNIYGNGVGLINGNGQSWYDRFATNATLERPTLMVLDGINGGSVTGLKLRQAPTWNFLVANSSSVLISNIEISVASTSDNTAKNTDGWDTYRSDNIVIQDSHINNGDDCVSFKPNSTNIVVQVTIPRLLSRYSLAQGSTYLR
jgi:galacturan 1,4-alpha-galacturonidase